MDRITRGRGRIAAGVLSGLLFALALPGLAAAKDAKVFDTPDAAAAGMIAALEAGSRDAITDLLGDQHNDQLFTDDEAAERENRKKALAAAKEKMSLRDDGDGQRTILIGNQEWPVPFPIVKGDKGWSFDTEEGIFELLARRIGADELAAIGALNALAGAQQDYQEVDQDGDEVLEYAQKLVSTPGKHDGLYWDTDPNSNAPASPLLAFVSAQGGYLEGRDAGDPLRGYNFRVLTRQGEGAPGGRYDYVINGNMIAGFGAIASPSEYGVTGIMTFIVNQQGKIYQKDLGDDTDLAAAALQSYDLDSSWTLTKDKGETEQ
jgi:type II secretory pathway pseudopilin PulG